MSHGQKDQIGGCDGGLIAIDDVLRLISAQNFPHMQRKPKVVIIQSCSGG